MINQELIQYIKQRIEAGNALIDIRRDVRTGGWKDSDFDEALAEIQKTLQPPAPSVPQAPPNDLISNHPLQQQSTFKIIFSVGIVMALIASVATGAYMYIAKIGPFSAAPYTEKNLLSGLFGAVSKINSSYYLLSTSLAMGNRDADASPFVSKLSNADEIQKKYQNDVKRAGDITFIISLLSSITESFAVSKISHRYPNSLNDLFKNMPNDPVTGKPYTYATSDNGRTFSLSVTLETNEAISVIKSFYSKVKSSSSSVVLPTIKGREVTFTQNTSVYLYLPSSLPKPFLIGLADYMADISPETKVTASVGIQTNFDTTGSTDWKFNTDFTGDFGDLTYKVNLDALRKGDTFYFKVNNLPSLFLSYIGVEKGQWIKMDISNIASSTTSYSGRLASGLSDAGKQYKQHHQEFVDLVKKMITIADDEGLISFKRPPYSENIDGQNLYRYDLAINKDATLGFYRRVQDEVNKTTIAGDFPTLTDSSYIDYLQSPEFAEISDYYQKNTTLTLWVDSQGFPVIVSYNMRIVPPDSATQLKDKQANLILTLKLSDINKSVDIIAPADAKDLQFLQSQVSSGLTVSRARAGDAKRIADIGSIQQALLLYLDSNSNYPANLHQLVIDKLLPSDPTGPNPNETYKYAVSSNGLSYHLGTVLEQLSNGTGAMASDSDCSSMVNGKPLCPGFSAGVPGGFSGADPVYDVTP